MDCFPSENCEYVDATFDQNGCQTSCGTLKCGCLVMDCFPPENCEYVDATFDHNGCQTSCGTLKCGCLVMDCFPPKNCQYVDATFDQNGCQTSCGTLKCCPVMDCFPPPNCQYVGAPVDQYGCQTGCGTLKCTCPPGEEFKQCGTACPATCDKPNPGFCSKQCVSGCFCKEGLLRNSDGWCQTADQCSVVVVDSAASQVDAVVDNGVDVVADNGVDAVVDNGVDAVADNGSRSVFLEKGDTDPSTPIPAGGLRLRPRHCLTMTCPVLTCLHTYYPPTGCCRKCVPIGCADGKPNTGEDCPNDERCPSGSYCSHNLGTGPNYGVCCRIKCCPTSTKPLIANCPYGIRCCENGFWSCADSRGYYKCDDHPSRGPWSKECPSPPFCCDPTKEPGQSGNPHCIEGHTCCPLTGEWVCNNGGGESSCSGGVPCTAPRVLLDSGSDIREAERKRPAQNRTDFASNKLNGE